MTTLPNFPMVSQRTTVTSDGKPSEDALYDCVPASIGAIMLWLLGKSQWDTSINPDLLKDKVYGDSYTGGTDAARYIDVCKSMGFHLYSIPMNTLDTVRQLLVENKPVIFTELDPYVDTALTQYAGWTHVCVWFSSDLNGLTAMDPFIAQPVYKSDATWTRLLRANQVWTVERIPMSTIPQGWKDDGVHLTAPNGHSCRDGFRKWVLEHNWNPTNVPLQEEQGLTPLEGSNPPLGGGTRQLFNETMLEWTAARGVFVGYVGRELLWREDVYGQLYADRQQKIAQIAQLQAQLQQLQGQTQVSPQVLTDMQQVEAIAKKYAS